MPMNSRDFELIAVSHILTRYRLTGELPNINGKPFNINDFRAKLFAGVDDQDININIDTVKTESNVTIVENIECDDNHHTHEHEAPASETPLISAGEIAADDPSQQVEQKSESEPLTPSGRLFQYFNRDRQP